MPIYLIKSVAKKTPTTQVIGKILMSINPEIAQDKNIQK
jgi:hypothetical protein